MATEKRLIERIADRLKDAYPQADRNNLCPAICYDDFAEIVDDVLSEFEEAVDAVEVVHGRWCWEGKFKACSRCGSYVEWDETLGANFWKFCPHCGAKMDGGTDGSN